MADEAERAASVDHRLESVSFFDAKLKNVRQQVFFQWGRTVFILCIYTLAVLSFFWGSQFHTEANQAALTVWVVDFDGRTEPSYTSNPLLGPIVVDVVNRISQNPTGHCGYTVKSPADFEYNPVAVRQAIYDEHAYAAVTVHPNGTRRLHDAVSGINPTYDSKGAIEIVTISARDQSIYSTKIQPQLRRLQVAIMSEFGPRWTQELASQQLANSRDLIQAQVPPQAVNPGIGFTTIDLRPFRPAAAMPSVTVGLIYLIIIAYFNFPFLLPVHAQFNRSSHDQPTLKISHWIIWRITSAIAAYLFLSLFYSFISLMFHIPFTNPPAPETQPSDNPNGYGNASFIIFWMLNWVGMAALGLPCEVMAMALGFPWSGLFLVFWVMSNVTTGFYSLNLAPGFFAWGCVWPLHRIIEALHTILFNTSSHIGRDFAVLSTWVAVSLILYPVAALIMWRRMKRGS
ncbi:hypothetical protein IFM58399_09783 [Aspergillus lentulus]|uniref:DUF3533 domain-containing protein n=1 Tax=Aspergillus lentulus TaxID=293939 RepID=A0ABQ1AD96_ASPLE|nr:uncharacterized protein IFM58399_09783 [Aspergillus lentulus]KAF4185112.1 hypothetical protein CNMCM7927_007137 [Aspergillus lentulus]GFF54261.1 hypothetical protein IFM58399_09783 [Aspergillus lentulus]GFF60200.1 hypothetical protein IFM62136_04495 [Aspergillus lentulus]GFF79348.1 hypothetical protein IFM60648_05450 [Aspergillus lentulus]GFF96261.1 hypothetical protein IFM47457_10786 [Aspergillus lentulus]